MSEIHKALAIFGLEPGASQDSIQRRYKRLIMVWHPDRFPTEDGKKDAEEELKKINNANDVLKKHFATGHRTSGCECQKPAGAASAGGGASHDQRHGPGPGPGPQRKHEDAEAQARARDEERKRKAAAEEAARKAAEYQQQQQQKTAQASLEQAQKLQDEKKWNKIRWQIAVGELALFVGLCIFGNVGHGVKEWWHKFSWEWERDHAPKPAPTQTPPSYSNDLTPPYSVTPQANPNPFGPPMPPPGDNSNMLPNGVMKPLDNSRVPIPTYPSTTTPPAQSDTFRWKPVTPDSQSNGPSPFAPPGPPTTNTGIDYDRYIKKE
jgi:hypothetical protein